MKRRINIGIKRHKPEEIVAKLQKVEVLCCKGVPRIDAIRQVQIAEQTFYRRRKQDGGMGADQLRELKRLQNWSRLDKARSSKLRLCEIGLKP